MVSVIHSMSRTENTTHTKIAAHKRTRFVSLTLFFIYKNSISPVCDADRKHSFSSVDTSSPSPRLHARYSHFLFDSYAHGSLLCTHECLTSAQTASMLSTRSKNIMPLPVPLSSRSWQLKRRLHKWPPMHTTNLQMYK